MTLDEYKTAREGLKHGVLGPIGPPRVYLIDVPAGNRPASVFSKAAHGQHLPPPARGTISFPAVSRGGRPGLPTLRESSRRPASPPPRRVGYADGSPHLLCKICLELAHVGRSLTCSRCAAEIAWRVSLARQGLKIVS